MVNLDKVSLLNVTLFSCNLPQLYFGDLQLRYLIILVNNSQHFMIFPYPVNSEDVYHVISGNGFILQLISLLGRAQYSLHPSESWEMAYHEYFLQLGSPPSLSPLFYHPEGHDNKEGIVSVRLLVNTVSLYYWLDHISTYKSGQTVT